MNEPPLLVPRQRVYEDNPSDKLEDELRDGGACGTNRKPGSMEHERKRCRAEDRDGLREVVVPGAGAIEEGNIGEIYAQEVEWGE